MSRDMLFQILGVRATKQPFSKLSRIITIMNYYKVYIHSSKKKIKAHCSNQAFSVD